MRPSFEPFGLSHTHAHTRTRTRTHTHTHTSKPTLRGRPTFHELGEGLGAGGGDGQGQLVDRHAVGYGQPVDAPVGHLARQQLPQQHPVAGRTDAQRTDTQTYPQAGTHTQTHTEL